jgi:arsenical pump membrane protein
VATGLLPHHEASATIRRILPLLLFLGSVIVLAELTADAGVFDVIAVRVARLARGNYAALFVLCVFFAAATTTVLNLDTTAVLLTPVMLALARRAGIAVIPLAMTTVWLANTASLLLPVSNLTNLLAANRVGLPAAEFASRMWPVQLVSIAVTMVFLWVFFWRRGARGADRYDPPLPLAPDDPVLFWVAALACLLFITVIITTGIALGYAAALAAAPVLAAFAARKRLPLLRHRRADAHVRPHRRRAGRGRPRRHRRRTAAQRIFRWAPNRLPAGIPASIVSSCPKFPSACWRSLLI